LKSNACRMMFGAVRRQRLGVEHRAGNSRQRHPVGRFHQAVEPPDAVISHVVSLRAEEPVAEAPERQSEAGRSQEGRRKPRAKRRRQTEAKK
jgi:hypothetical protein